MRDDFCVFILTHGRPDNVRTYRTLKASGYSGRIYLVVDDEDKTANQYLSRYGDEVIRFCKADVQATMDDGDNFEGRGSVIYARNACWDLAEQVGCRYFVQLDDDYGSFFYRFDTEGNYTANRIRKTADLMWEAMIKFVATTPFVTAALSQGGDHIGGDPGVQRLKRKSMNSFVCSVDRPFKFMGRMNDDVNTYVTLGMRGILFATTMSAQLNQEQTQAAAGGLTEMYLDYGTYAKSFYTVMYAPSCTQIGLIADNRSPHPRIHHAINWHNAVPVILDQKHRKGRS